MDCSNLSLFLSETTGMVMVMCLVDGVGGCVIRAQYNSGHRVYNYAMKSSSLLGLIVNLTYDKCFQLNGLFKSLPVFVCNDWHGDGHVFSRRSWRLHH